MGILWASIFLTRVVILIMHTSLLRREATIGGLAMAVGMTTHSHISGLLQETVVEYEVVLGDGR